MRYAKSLFSIGLPFFATGCSIHPLPEDYSRNATVEIVHKIRCEARAAIIEYAIEKPVIFEETLSKKLRGIPRAIQLERAAADKALRDAQKEILALEHSRNSNNDEKLREKERNTRGSGILDVGPPEEGDPQLEAAHSKKANAQDDRDKIYSDEAVYNAKTNAAKSLIAPGLKEAHIGYGFKFTISEKDNASSKSTFTFPFTNGKATLDLGIGEDKERKSDRIFDLRESFSDILLDSVLREKCYQAHAQWKYPITGRIGLDEVIRTYVQLAGLEAKFGKFTKPSGSDKPPTGGSDPSGGGDRSRDVSDFSDVLTFTTTYSGSISPAIELTPVSHDFRLTKASASFGGERKDAHSVTIALVQDLSGKGRTQHYIASRAVETGDNLKDILRERRLLDSLERGGF